MAQIPSRIMKTSPKIRSISKAQAYVTGVFSAEGDLEALIMAFGVKAVAEKVAELYEDMRDTPKYKNRDKAARKLRERVNGQVMGIDAELGE